ncbi:MAG: toprim domain-containing protein [Clostridiales bacterium]|jgi:hypothetical protein|nr:toprim domain-containing protein [Clostridiales bacterium]
MEGNGMAERAAEAKAADLPAYLMSRGEILKKGGGGNWTLENESFKMDCKAGKGWLCWRGGVGPAGLAKGNPVDFLMAYYCMRFTEAVEELTQGFGAIAMPAPKAVAQPAPKVEPIALAGQCRQALAYLCGKRGISPKIAGMLARDGRIGQTLGRPNVAFIALDEKGRNVGYEIRGIGAAKFHRAATEGGWPYCVAAGARTAPKGAYVFESAIDALSFWTICEKRIECALLASTHGLANTDKCVATLIRAYGLSDSQIRLCLDSDEPGRACMASRPQWKSVVLQGPFKDWNEMLVSAKR